MARKKTFNSPLRHVFMDANGRKCYQFEGFEGFWTFDMICQATLPIDSDYWEIYGYFFVINKKTGMVENSKKILTFTTRKEAEQKLQEIEKESEYLKNNKDKISTVIGFYFWLLRYSDAGELNSLFSKVNNVEVLKGVSKLLGLIFKPETQIKEVEAEIYSLTYKKLRILERSVILANCPELINDYSSDKPFLTETEIQNIISLLNRIFKKAKQVRFIDTEYKAIYKPKNKSTKNNHHHETNTLSKSEREKFFRFQVMLNEFFRDAPQNKIDPKIRSNNLITLLKESLCQRHPLFLNATLNHFIYKEKIEFSRHILDFEDSLNIRKNFSLVLVPKELEGSDKKYKVIVVPFSLEDDLYKITLPKMKYLQDDKPAPLLFSRNETGIQVGKNACPITYSTLRWYFEVIQKFLGFNGRMTIHSVKDNYFARSIVDGAIKSAMSKVGNDDINIVKENYLPVTLKCGYTVQFNELFESMLLADEFDVAYKRAVERGLEGFRKKEVLFIEKLTGKSITY